MSSDPVNSSVHSLWIPAYRLTPVGPLLNVIPSSVQPPFPIAVVDENRVDRPLVPLINPVHVPAPAELIDVTADPAPQLAPLRFGTIAPLENARPAPRFARVFVPSAVMPLPALTATVTAPLVP